MHEEQAAAVAAAAAAAAALAKVYQLIGGRGARGSWQLQQQTHQQHLLGLVSFWGQ